MLAQEILASLAFVAFLGFIYGLRQNKRLARSLAAQHEKADELLSRAKHIATFAAIEQPYAVCEGCGQIRSRYLQDENGITCIECAAKHTDGS